MGSERIFLKTTFGAICLILGFGLCAIVHYGKCEGKYYYFPRLSVSPYDKPVIQDFELRPFYYPYRYRRGPSVANCKDGKYHVEVVYLYTIAIGLIVAGLILAYEAFDDSRQERDKDSP